MNRKRKAPAKRTEASFKESVKKVCEQLRWLFYLNAFKLHLVWKTDTILEGAHADGHVAADVDIDCVYLNISIRFYKPVLEMYLDGHDDEVLDTLLHEFCHSFFAPITDLVRESLPKDLDSTLDKLIEQRTQLAAQVISSGNFLKLKSLLK